MMAESNRRNPFEDDVLASEYDAWFSTPVGQVADRLEKALVYRLAQPRSGESALDVGTGTGHWACDLARRGLRVTGCDSSEAMLRVARATGENVIWQQAEAEALPYPSDSFDLVLSVTALEFVRDPTRALDEMWRVVAPRGRLVVAVLNANSSWGWTYKRVAERQDTPFRHARFFSPAEFVAMLSRYGRLRWNSSVFFDPSGRDLAFADFWEKLGQTFCRGRGALLAGRVDK